MNTCPSLWQILLRKGRYSILTTPAPIWFFLLPGILPVGATGWSTGCAEV